MISPILTLSILLGYFVVLMVIARLTSKGAADNKSFFIANRQAPWYLVAFGMIGASLSGVTFISVPGEVDAKAFSYFQLVLGYLLGYFVIGTVLLPLYYKLNLTTIYTYLLQRFGFRSHKTGAFFFLLSRTIGTAFRLYLVALVLQIFILDHYNLEFYVAVILSIALILIYTFKGGIKTIVWTDTLQTLFMLIALVVTIVYISQGLGYDFSGLVEAVSADERSRIFTWDWRSPDFFWKQFMSGAFIAIVMTGLDQDMMQKNLACKNLREAQTNMFSFSVVLIFINFLFLVMGVLLFQYADHVALELPARSDYLYPTLALNHLPFFAAIAFIIGLTAAAYSSADSALTALTTSFCVDFLGFDTEKTERVNTRYIVHIGFAILCIGVILAFHYLLDSTVISSIFRIAGYTYGPLLGLFSFGLFTKWSVRDKWVPIVCVSAPLLTFMISLAAEGKIGGMFRAYSDHWADTIDIFLADIFQGYQFGFELLLINGMITFLGLLLLVRGKKN